MDSARKISIGNHSHEAWKYGYFIKSPPSNLFNNQTSWKRRFFILSKSMTDGYILKYLRGPQVKGDIKINDVSEIEIGIGDVEKMAIVKKMFKCESKEILTIRTNMRDYYLIGSDSKDVEDWANFLFTIIQTQDTEASAYKKRPVSDPSPKEASEHVYESPRKLLLRLRCLPNNRCLVPAEEQSEEKSKKEELYASPRSILAQARTGLDHKDIDSDSDGETYMPMKDFVHAEKIPSTHTSDGLLTFPGDLEKNVNLKVGEDISLKPTPQPRTFKPEKTSKLSYLSVVHLSKIFDKVTDDCQLEELDIILPQENLTESLTLTKASGHICVSQWKDLHHLGCIFHQGDHIVAVNELQVTSTDEISLFLSRSTRKEVKLTVCRLPDSNILHAQGCSCS
ncbi:pleckstrin homology domain-containing family S member 1 [Tiliqua scincoides]|uniref:pleckstrin homology domain-containing family S member 1 n=1 Tax=Tiliqua scincoides TaxID=71010 RepID=UPI0034627DA1